MKFLFLLSGNILCELNIATNWAERAAFYSNFRAVDYANDQISRARTSSWTADMHQAEMSDLWQICPVEKK